MSRNILDLFVDRRAELERFRRMLVGEARERILLVTEAGETGKTYFILRLFHECERQRPPIPVARVDFDSPKGATNHWDIARALRRHLGESHTPRICARDTEFPLRGPLIGGGAGDGGGVDFGRRNQFNQAEVQAAGRDLYNTTVNYTEAPPTAEQRAKDMADLGCAMRDDLAAMAQKHGRVVLLMDTFEHADPETCEWLDRWLLEPMRGPLAHVVLVVAGQPQCRPFFDRPRLWGGLIDMIDRFTPLTSEDVLTYYQQLGTPVPASETNLIAVARQSPARMAYIGDCLEQAQRGTR